MAFTPEEIANYAWAFGYYVTQDDPDLADAKWEFIYQQVSYEDAVTQVGLILEIIASAPENYRNIRDVGVFYSEPITWQRYDED